MNNNSAKKHMCFTGNKKENFFADIMFYKYWHRLG